MMKVGFDLDGTLDRPALADLAAVLLAAGHEVHVITGCFQEAGVWQDEVAKHDKLARMGLLYPKVQHEFHEKEFVATRGGFKTYYGGRGNLHVHVLAAVDHEKFDRQYRLVDLGLRKGALVEELGIDLMIDDSELYCETMPSMCGAQILRVMR